MQDAAVNTETTPVETEETKPETTEESSAPVLQMGDVDESELFGEPEVETKPEKEPETPAPEEEPKPTSLPQTFDNELLARARNLGIPAEIAKENFTPVGLRRWVDNSEEQIRASQQQAQMAQSPAQPSNIPVGFAPYEPKLGDEWDASIKNELGELSKHHVGHINAMAQQVAAMQGVLAQVINTISTYSAVQQLDQAISNLPEKYQAFVGKGPMNGLTDETQIQTRAEVGKEVIALQRAFPNEPINKLALRAVKSFFAEKLEQAASENAKKDLSNKLNAGMNMASNRPRASSPAGSKTGLDAAVRYAEQHHPAKNL